MARGKKQRFKRPDDPFYDPDDEEQWNRAHGEDSEDEEKQVAIINEVYLQAFVDSYEPAYDESEAGVEFHSIGQLRNELHCWVGYSGTGKPTDALPYYLNALRPHGFVWKEGFDGTFGLLVRHRNRRNLTTILNPDEDCDVSDIRLTNI